ncbi:hypothetical protein [Neobacillus niacini]|uniref:hypothetical protein n=1 Tax=Neobacillus niacini TaxID=86668 RepID=UPI0005EDEBE9|nr:hypothetical protein [Neobacillus niacini]
MAKNWILKNAVKKYKPHLIQTLKNNKGNLNTDSVESLVKEMKCDYEIVEVKGKGRERIIYTDKKRKEKEKKGDKRRFNKGIAPPHSKHLALMIMSKMDDIDNKPRSRNGWATYFELISPSEQDIMNGIFSEEALKPYKAHMIKIGILEDGEEKLFQDLANTLTKVAKGQLQTALNHAEDMKLISRKSSWKGKVKGSREPIDIDKEIADEINFIEDELLKRHGISKAYSLMIKNCPKTKAYKAEWLEYIENVEDAEGDAMHLQYIYEVFQIDVLSENVFDEYINTHYPSEANSFNLIENEQAYHRKLLDYVVENAQRKHDNYLMKKLGKKVQLEDGTKELMIALGKSEEVDASIQHWEEEQAFLNGREPSPYMALLESEKYVDCIRNIFIELHGINAIDSENFKKVQQLNHEQEREELSRLGLRNRAEVERQKSVKNQILNNDESSLNAMEQQEEPTNREQSKQHQTNEAAKEIELENIEEKRVTTVAESNIEPSNHYDEILDDEYQAAMEDIRNEIREYEEKHGDKAMEFMRLDSVIRELTREVTAEESIAEFKQKLQQEHKKWEKQFEGRQPTKWSQTTNNPIEIFQRIRHGGNDKEDS